jgi:hypothetical protein
LRDDITGHWPVSRHETGTIAIMVKLIIPWAEVDMVNPILSLCDKSGIPLRIHRHSIFGQRTTIVHFLVYGFSTKILSREKYE